LKNLVVPAFSSWALDGSEGYLYALILLPLKKELPGWVISRASLDASEKRKIFCLYWELNHAFSVI